MLCPNCGVMNDDFQTVCLNCGEPLTPGFVMCPVCGKVLRSGEKTCPRCKSNLIEKTVLKNERIEHYAITPKYVVKAPLSMLTILSILAFFSYSLVYNIIVFFIRNNHKYDSLGFYKIVKLFVSTETRPIVCFALFILSLITFIERASINRKHEVKELEKRLVVLKCLLLADVTGFFTYFMISFWPTFFEEHQMIYYIGGIIGMSALIISLISLPLFYKRARVRTR